MGWETRFQNNDPSYLEPRISNVESSLAESMKHTAGFVSITESQFGAVANYNTSTKTGTDNTTAIQNAINYANTNNLAVRIPLGNYLVSGSIQLQRNTIIISEGANIYYNGTGTCILATGTSTTYIYPEIYGLIVRQVSTTPTGTGMVVQYSRMGGRFVDCQFFGFQTGVHHSSNDPLANSDGAWAWLTWFERCSFRYCQTGIYLDVNSNGVTIMNCLINNNTNVGLYAIDSSNIRVTNNEFELNGQLSGGHAIQLSHVSSALIQGNYFESNGFTDSSSAIILVDGYSSSYSYHPQIIANYFACHSIYSAITFGLSQSGYVTGNYFYDTNPPTYDIDLSSVNSTTNMTIFGNRPSGTSKLNNPSGGYSSTSWVSHGDNGWHKSTFELIGNNTNILLHDDVNSANMKIDTVNNKMRLWNKSSVNFVTFNGDTNQITMAIQSGATASRPATPTTGQHYFDTTLNKPVWWNGSAWKDATGTTV